MVNLHLLRAGMPDKACRWSDGTYNSIKHDFTNLVDYNKSELEEIIKDDYIICFDEGDIKWANKLYEEGLIDQSHIILPQNSNKEIINYNDYVTKDSKFYSSLVGNDVIRYANFTKVNLEEFIDLYHTGKIEEYGKIAIKSTTGSGSRGVWLINPDSVKYGGKYINKFTDFEFNNFTKFVKNENCNIIIQDLVKVDENNPRVNIDFVIKNGELIGYKWSEVSLYDQFTNWNSAYIVNSELTDHIMNKVTDLLKTNNVTNGILGIDGVLTQNNELYIIEVNWRMCTCAFETEAFGIDIIGSYLSGNKFKAPYGRNKYIRYWRCQFFNQISNYKIGK